MGSSATPSPSPTPSAVKFFRLASRKGIGAKSWKTCRGNSSADLLPRSSRCRQQRREAAKKTVVSNDVARLSAVTATSVQAAEDSHKEKCSAPRRHLLGGKAKVASCHATKKRERLGPC